MGDKYIKKEPYSLPTLTCKRCGHSWYPRSNKRPLRCALCKSPYWHLEKIVRSENTEDLSKVGTG